MRRLALRLLLDTHALLWWMLGDSALSTVARNAIENSTAQVWVSAASYWEISIKAKLGRLDISVENLQANILKQAFLELPMKSSHAWAAGQLQRHHDDPFDRMLIAQAQLEAMTVVTRDNAFRQYQLQLLW